MKKSNTITRTGCAFFCALCCLLAQTTAKAVFPVVVPFVEISVTGQIDLGTISQPGTYDSPATMTVHVKTNCLTTGVLAQAAPLQGSGGSVLTPDRFFISGPATGGYVPLDSQVNISGPLGPGAFDIVLNFRVITDINNQAGTYSGTIVFTCGVCP